MLDRHRKRLDEIANRGSKLKRSAMPSPSIMEYGVQLNENKRIIHEIRQQCKFRDDKTFLLISLII